MEKTTKLRMKNIYEFITEFKQCSDLKLLPFTHTMKEVDFINMLSDKEILYPSYDDTLKQELLFFNYGKPSYIINNKGNGDEFYVPVCLLFKGETVKISNIYPFDTGGYNKIKAAKYSFDITDFKIGNTYQDIKKYIQMIYLNNSNYCKGLVKYEFDTEAFVLEKNTMFF